MMIMIFIAHRGFRVGGLLENTLTAFHKAVELEMDYIELDIHISQDGIIYVLHDDSLERTMVGSGLIHELSSKELDEIVTHNRRDQLPRLTTVFEQIFTSQNETTKLMIELKGENTATALCELIKQHKYQDKVVFSGRNLQELKKAYQLLPEVPICLNITKCQEFTLQDLFQIQNQSEFPIPFSMISLKSTQITDSNFVEICHKWGIQALAWHFMVHSLEILLRMQDLLEMGMDGLLLDDPKSVITLRQYLSLE